MIRPLWLRRILRPFDRLPKTDRRGPRPAPREPLQVGDRIRWHDDAGPVDGTVVVAGPFAHIECDDGSRVFVPDGRPGGPLERTGRRDEG